MKYIFLLSIFIMACMTKQQSARLAGMEVSWWYEQNELVIDVVSPANGWVAIGFNERDHIVATNLIMLGVRNGKPYLSDRYVVGFGDHRSVEELGGEIRAHLLVAEEFSTGTHVRFSIPASPRDEHHYNLLPNTERYLIAAYSVSDDLDHHSRQRAHMLFEL